MPERRKQFTFYSSYYDAVLHLNKRDQRDVLMAICAYAIDGAEPKLTGAAASAFILIRPTLDFERRQSIEGRRSSEYKKWRNSVFERDDYTCQECGCRGVKLNAHHIKEYAFFPELRYEIENGTTLCVTCHKAAHRRVRHG